MTTTQTVNLGPMLSSRRLFDIERRLVPVERDLSDMLDGRGGAIPDLPRDAAGYRFLSLSEAEAEDIAARLPDMVMGRKRSYGRRYIEMGQSFEAYMGGFSGKTRSTLRRKRRKFADLSGGSVDMRAFHGPGEIDRFFDLALPLSARTYQDRLLNAGLPHDERFRKDARSSAKRDEVRAFLLFVDKRPVSYLYLPVSGSEGRRTLRYDYLGYDPEFTNWSPGTVLQLEALESLMAEARFAWFDFTSGEGAHKTLFGTGEVRGVDFVMLRPELANRLLIGAVDGVDAAVERAGAIAQRFGVKSAVKKLLRRG